MSGCTVCVRRKLTLLECPPRSEDFRVGCVFMGSVFLAGRGRRDPVQNNGTTVECGTAGNILSQTQGSPGV